MICFLGVAVYIMSCTTIEGLKQEQIPYCMTKDPISGYEGFYPVEDLVKSYYAPITRGDQYDCDDIY